MSFWIPLAPMNPRYVNYYTAPIPLGYQHRYPAAHRLTDGPEALHVRLFNEDHLIRARRRRAGPRAAHTPFERTLATHAVASSATISHGTSRVMHQGRRQGTKDYSLATLRYVVFKDYDVCNVRFLGFLSFIFHSSQYSTHQERPHWLDRSWFKCFSHIEVLVQKRRYVLLLKHHFILKIYPQRQWYAVPQKQTRVS